MLFAPQQYALVDTPTAQVEPAPVATSMTLSGMFTATGTFETVLLPVPSCRQSLFPQQYNTLPNVMPQLWSEPADTFLNDRPPATATGTYDCEMLVPLPSEPHELVPQHQAFESRSMAHVWRPNVFSCANLWSPGTLTGEDLKRLLPTAASPIRPSAPLRPQQYAMPPLAMSQACIVPALTER